MRASRFILLCMYSSEAEVYSEVGCEYMCQKQKIENFSRALRTKQASCHIKARKLKKLKLAQLNVEKFVSFLAEKPQISFCEGIRKEK